MAGLRDIKRKEERAPSETLSGEYHNRLTYSDFIAFPGQLDGQYGIKALVDTGGPANLIARKWLEDHKIPIPDANLNQTETEKLRKVDGRISEPLSVIRMSWKYDDRDTVWTQVKFIVTGQGPDAVLGLPFLKRTQIIHSSTGHLVFPEFDSLPSPSTLADVKPIYHDKRVGPTGSMK